MKKIVTVIALVALYAAAYAQNIQASTLEWRSTSSSTIDTGSLVNEFTRVVSSATEITWYDEQNTPRKVMTITGVIGSWTNISSNGAITYNVNAGEQSGIVQFWKVDGYTRIRIHMTGEGESVAYELSITNVTVQ